MLSNRISLSASVVALVLACVGCASTQDATASSMSTAPAAAAKAGAKDFSIEGYYVEACSCRPPCPCELTGPKMGCQGMGAYHFTKGTYGGSDFSGVTLAYSLYIGENVQLYIDAPDATKRAATEEFGRAALAAFGPIKGVHEAKIDLAGKDGEYTVAVDGGKVMKCATKPVLGGDKKTPVTHGNTQDALNPVMYQALCTGASYADGEMKIDLDNGCNSYFNQHMKSSGKL
jgi:hypothetical protein